MMEIARIRHIVYGAGVHESTCFIPLILRDQIGVPFNGSAKS